MLRAAKVDANQPEIVRKLRQIGAGVLVISQLKNCFDILVAYRGKWFAFEIKIDDKQKLTPGEQKFYNEFAHKAPLFVVTSFEEILNIITKR